MSNQSNNTATRDGFDASGFEASITIAHSRHDVFMSYMALKQRGYQLDGFQQSSVRDDLRSIIEHANKAIKIMDKEYIRRS